ncbi:MAG TPA: phosphatase PAP2 family protein [Pirellulales bacterium]|jgi:hypothetical protein|nr:phosphatase PAP2 family protein [Pirellulales bacterium]
MRHYIHPLRWLYCLLALGLTGCVTTTPDWSSAQSTLPGAAKADAQELARAANQLAPAEPARAIEAGAATAPLTNPIITKMDVTDPSAASPTATSPRGKDAFEATETYLSWLEASDEQSPVYVTAAYAPAEEPAVFDYGEVDPNEPSPALAEAAKAPWQTASFDSPLAPSQSAPTAARGGAPSPTSAVPGAVADAAEPAASAPAVSTATEPEPPFTHRAPLTVRLFGDVKSDFVNFFSGENLAIMGVGFGVGLAFADTTLDQKIRDSYQSHAGSTAHRVLHRFKFYGTGQYVVPVMAVAAVSEYFWPDTLVGEYFGAWGENSLRALLIGSGPMLVMQRVTGAGRPSSYGHASKWSFWNDNNGVSGHAFVGGVAFMSAAQLTDNWFLKTSFYALSLMPGISRISDDAHYTSQVFLGYMLAYVACSAVDLTNFQSEHMALVPLEAENTTGIGIEFRR